MYVQNHGEILVLDQAPGVKGEGASAPTSPLVYATA